MSVSDDEAAEAAWLPELDFPLSEAALDQGIANTAKQIFHLAKQGKAISLYAVLAERSAPEQEILLATLTTHDRQSTPPLVIAARNGHVKVVRMLISKFKPDLAVTGTVNFSHYIIEGASALWCAAGAGHVEVVKELVRAGADVNQTTKINSTPLRAACYEGRLDIVEYLHAHGADLHIANQYNNTCLMIAAYKGHLDVVKFLLAKGADPNVAANCGATALHFSAESGFVEIVRELFLSGAVMKKSEHGMTPLLAAAERCQEFVVNYIVDREDVSKQERIEALELIGASYGNDKEHYDIAKCYKYLLKAMTERWSDPKEPLPKPVRPSIEAYDNRVECEVLEDLIAIQHDLNTLHMECLAIRERILGPENPDLPHPIVFRGAVFADSADFDQCMKLWMHAMLLKLKQKASVAKDLLRFAQVFSQMLHVGIDIEISKFLEITAFSLTAITQNMATIKNPTPKDDKESMSEDLKCNMTTFLYLIVIYTKIRPKVKEEDDFAFMQLVFDTVALNPMTMTTKQGLLHLAVSSETPVDDFHTSSIVRFPCSATTKILLEVGADASAMDAQGDTPLHRIALYQRVVTDFLTIHGIITNLIEAGAHMDVVNAAGKTPLQAATTGVAQIILKSQAKLSLKCLAAQSVKKHNVTYQGQVPTALENFIALHGP